jgi:ubiquinol-cytochrome c reductase cytochrome b subunit
MSFWGATVITNLMSAIPWIGNDFVEFLWGGFSVGNPTLNRFFSLHYLLPFILAALVIMHLIALHEHGSNNPLGITSNVDRIRFHPYYSFKDLVGVFVFFFIFAYFVFFNPNFFGESDNYIPANPLVTPISIVPEFYLLPFYAILRSIPHKLLGVIGMVAAILILLVTPFLDTSRIRSMQFRPIMKFFFWLFVVNFLILGWIGANHPESPLVEIGQVSTVFYFSYFLVILPVVGIIENTLFDLGTKTK